MTEIKKYIITKDQLDANNNYIGLVDLSDFDGAIDAEGNLGYVKFKSLCARFSIRFGAGTGIEAGEGIKAGWGIKAGEGIEAGFSIHAKFLSSKLRIFAGLCDRRLPTQEEKQICVEILEGGEIAYGELVIKKGEMNTKDQITREEV